MAQHREPANGPETMAAGAGPRVYALAADLMFASRIRGAGEMVGTPVKLLRSGSALVEAVRAAGGGLVLLDLDARGLLPGELIPALHGVGARVVCFVAHVNVERIEEARAAGADRVLARSAFVRELPALLADRALQQ
jgi:DNA-binding NarL/FixJ family response regulator